MDNIEYKEKIADLRSEIKILKATLKESNSNYNNILKAFNELMDDHITALERLGEVDVTNVRYDYFEKAGILD